MRIKGRTIKRTVFVWIAAVLLFSCNKQPNEEPMKIEWDKIGSEGLQGDLTKGVSAAYAALLEGQLIVAGGANFPGKLGFEGGAKAFYDEILSYDPANGFWKVIGKLPQPSAYGVSVPIPGGALWIGGNTATESLASCYKVSLQENSIGSQNDKELTPGVEWAPFLSLPATMDNFSGCAIGATVYVAGGNVNGIPSNTLHSINLENDSTWTELPPFPGLPRVQPVMAAVEEKGKTYLYLLGGFFGGDTEREPGMAIDVLRYDPDVRSWEKMGEQVDPDTGEAFSLGGATTMPVDNRYILCLGGVNHDIFLDAITTQYKIACDTSLTEEEKRERNHEFSSHYMTQPIDYYRFNTECRVFDTKTGEWSTIDRTHNAARAGTTLVWKGYTFYAVQGELKPGVRSPETWKGEIIVQ